MSNPILKFDTEKEELHITIGDEVLIIEGFVRSASGTEHQAVLSVLGQEKLIKKLVANMTLFFGGRIIL